MYDRFVFVGVSICDRLGQGICERSVQRSVRLVLECAPNLRNCRSSLVRAAACFSSASPRMCSASSLKPETAGVV